jgi:ribosome biogenesis GTPase
LLRPYLSAGQTVVFLGSSGVGKSTLINALLGCEQQATNPVRADDSRGRHTTTHRELFVLPTGGVVIDVPGLRELQLWDGGDGLGATFADIEDFAAHCRFRDCTHREEPGCAVQAALTAGELDAAHFENYCKLQLELQHLACEQDRHARAAEKARWRSIAKAQRHLKNERKQWRL